MFSFPLIAGDASTALDDGNNIAISRKMSDLFCDTRKRLATTKQASTLLPSPNKLYLQVTAYSKALGPNTSMKFDFLASWELHATLQMDGSSNYVNGTLLLAPEPMLSRVTESLNTLLASRRKNSKA